MNMNMEPAGHVVSDSQIALELEAYRERALALEHQLFELRALLQSGKGFSQIFKVEDLLHAFMAVCRERCDASNAAVLLEDDLDPDTRQFRVRAYHNVPDRYTAADGVEEELFVFRVPEDEGLFWQVLKQGDVTGVRQMDGSPRFPTAWRKWSLHVMQADVWVPLMRAGKVIGILTLGATADGTRIPESDYHFLKEIADVAAASISFTIEFERSNQILDNLRTLYDINQQLANVNDFKTLTIETLSTAVHAMKAQRANLMLLNEETGKLDIRVVWGDIPKAVRDGINEGRIRTRSLALGEGVAGQAAQMGKPLRLNHRSKIEQFSTNPVHCIMAVPLTYGGRLLGVINLTNKVDADGSEDPIGRYTEQDEHLAKGLADQAAHNLHKARLYDASITDRLTGLKNNRHFQEQLEKAMARCRGDATGLCLAIVDIDHFKRFNDTYGHKAGDFVLMQTARILEANCRNNGHDQAFRYGGEEFCMVLTETELEVAYERMDGFRSAVENAEHVWQHQALKVTVSVGICHFPSGAKNTRDLFELADNALYAAKQAGRNQVCMAEANAQSPATAIEAVEAVAPAPAESPAPTLATAQPADITLAFDNESLFDLMPTGAAKSTFTPDPPSYDDDSDSGDVHPEEFATNNLLPIDDDDPLAAMMS